MSGCVRARPDRGRRSKTSGTPVGFQGRRRGAVSVCPLQRRVARRLACSIRHRLGEKATCLRQGRRAVAVKGRFLLTLPIGTISTARLEDAAPTRGPSPRTDSSGDSKALTSKNRPSLSLTDGDGVAPAHSPAMVPPPPVSPPPPGRALDAGARCSIKSKAWLVSEIRLPDQEAVQMQGILTQSALPHVVPARLGM